MNPAPHDPAEPHRLDSGHTAAAAGAAEAAVCWSSDALLRGQQVVYIEHKGATYQLRLTRQDKLILTK